MHHENSIPDSYSVVNVNVLPLSTAYCRTFYGKHGHLLDAYLWDTRGRILWWYYFTGCKCTPYEERSRQKTDMRDSEWISTLLRAELLNGSFIPEKRIRLSPVLFHFWHFWCFRQEHHPALDRARANWPDCFRLLLKNKDKKPYRWNRCWYETI